MSKLFEINTDHSRRRFLRASAVIGGGLAIGVYLPVASRFANAAPAKKTFVPNYELYGVVPFPISSTTYYI